MTALPADTGAEFYCAATDDTGSVESLHFILVLDPPVPASTVCTLLIGALSFIVFGVLYTRRQFARDLGFKEADSSSKRNPSKKKRRHHRRFR